MVDKIPITADDFIEAQLDQCVKVLEEKLSSDVMALKGGIIGGVDDFLRAIVEEKKRQSSQKSLAFFLTTSGGYLEVVQRMVDTLRYHYDVVDFYIPDYALSAGTVLAMSGDSIHMNYYSRLGPIDPQVQSSGGRAVSALGYIKKWERLLEKANTNTISLAEIQLMIEGFDQAELYHYEQARELSVSLIEEWLARYKFKNWEKTVTQGKKVTEKIRRTRAKEIAQKLNDTDTWHIHSRGISMEQLRRDLKLLIDDFDDIPELSSAIRSYHSLLIDYSNKSGHEGVIHTYGTYKPYIEDDEDE